MLKRGSLRVVIIVLAFFPCPLMSITDTFLQLKSTELVSRRGGGSLERYSSPCGTGKFCCLVRQGEVQPFKNHGYQSNLYLFPFCHFSCFSSETSDDLISYWIGAEMAQFCRVHSAGCEHMLKTPGVPWARIVCMLVKAFISKTSNTLQAVPCRCFPSHTFTVLMCWSRLQWNDPENTPERLRGMLYCFPNLNQSPHSPYSSSHVLDWCGNGLSGCKGLPK